MIKEYLGFYSASGSLFRVLFKIRPAASGPGFSILFKIRPTASGSLFRALFKYDLQRLVQDSGYY